DDFACHCSPDFLANSLQLVLDRLEERAKQKAFVELLPLPTAVTNLARLKRLFRYTVYTKYYPEEPDTRAYLDGGIREKLAQNPAYVDEQIARIGAELRARPSYVYATRQKGFTWQGLPTEEVDPMLEEEARPLEAAAAPEPAPPRR
ncbi:MAG TPA: hypothetical protein VHB21_07320, partial [Minicystis sp.]|nr:hypothetical protein [Minicystis sp.]